MMRRRALFGVALAAPFLASAAAAELALACDPAIAAAVTRIAGAYRARNGIRVHVHPTAPGLLVPQLEREVQNDVILVQDEIMDQAVARGIVAGPPAAKRWRNRLVLAGLASRTLPPAPGPVAVPDRWPGSSLDAPALLAAIGLQPTAVGGAANTQEIGFLLLSGAAQTGIMHLTEIRAEPRLQVLAQFPDGAYRPIIYRAAVSRLARRGNPADFLAFMNGSDALLAAAGLEVLT